MLILKRLLLVTVLLATVITFYDPVSGQVCTVTPDGKVDCHKVVVT